MNRDKDIDDPKVEIDALSMDGLDRAILRALQYDFPLKERPFDVLAEKLGVDADLLWRRVQALLEQGVIRRLGASLDSQKLGFSGTLAAVRVPSDRVDLAAETISRYPEVTHSYLRDHEFNIWFTIIAPDAGRIETILREIGRKLSLKTDDILNIPMKQLFKLDARFHGQS